MSINSVKQEGLTKAQFIAMLANPNLAQRRGCVVVILPTAGGTPPTGFLNETTLTSSTAISSGNWQPLGTDGGTNTYYRLDFELQRGADIVFTDPSGVQSVLDMDKSAVWVERG